ncbi:MAG: hypothetical protein A2161_05555 [Candidatus Schekmanbacteria bacterium RBG_13_48_7]|uniref:Radical SAM core domain-containing protein n=1 Tax=Candidatus Schekmanbacteria bacterium RBG_13_48_7 TaxID=1817878 RepID=A0A1F7S4Q8_9BACT|nr:MAG: hypothetical protein A2161_05555 [Candidatus Schekmanbacteria bacterium RBG_13_48_7]
MQECQEIDIGVLGEGEYTLLEICRKFENGESMLRIPGTIVRSNNTIEFNSPRELEKDIDNFPIPDRGLFGDLHRYSHTPFRGSKFTVSMISSRGCPFSCAYCDQSIFGRTWRGHSPERVIEEIELIKKNFGANFISFEDDNFLLDKKRSMEFCGLLKQRNTGIEWGCSVRINSLDDKILDAMKSAGCRVIYIGIETGTSRILEILNRNISLDQVREGVKRVKSKGIKIYGSFILGFPGETLDEIMHTIDFSLELPLDGVSYFLFTPYPNIKLREMALKNGSVSQNWADYSTHPGRLPYIPNDIAEKELLKLQMLAYRKFFLRWVYMRKHLPMIFRLSFLKQAIPMIKKLIR